MNSTPPDLPTAEPPVESMSLGSRLTNVIAAPGELYQYLARAPSSAVNWLLPLILVSVLGWIGTTVVFSQPWVVQQISEMQEKAIEDSLKKRGMNAEQIEQAKQSALPMVVLTTRIGAYAGPPVLALLGCLFWGFLAWLLGTKLYDASFTFGKALELVGLTLVIDALAAIVKTFLILATGHFMAGPNAALLVGPFDPANPVHTLLSQIDVFTLWGLALIALGISRLTGRSFLAPAAWVFGIWFVIRGALATLGFLAQRAGQG